MSSWKNVVYIVMDCGRYSLINPETAPFLTELGKKGVVYHQHYSTAPWTLPSHASMFTGLYTREHGTEHESMILHPSIRTISELFRDVGYQTVAISNNPWVGPLTGLDRGFDHFYGVWMKKMFRFIPVGQKIRNKVKKIVMEYSKFLDYRDSGAERTIGRVREWNNKIYDEHRPYFMFINFMELHHPYKPPEPFRSKFFKSSVPYADLEQDYRKINGKCSEKVVDFDCLRMLCDGEQAYLDSRIRDLFRFLDDDNTVWIITSDHGDLLGEEGGRVGHRFSLHRNLLHVPLIIYDGGKHLEQNYLTQHTDLYEALVDFIGYNGRDFPVVTRARSFGVAEHTNPIPLLKQLKEEEHFGPKFDLKEHSVDLFSIFTKELQMIERDYHNGIYKTDYFPVLFTGREQTELTSWRTHWEEHCLKPPLPSPSPGFDATLKYLRERGFF